MLFTINIRAPKTLATLNRMGIYLREQYKHEKTSKLLLKRNDELHHWLEKLSARHKGHVFSMDAVARILTERLMKINIIDKRLGKVKDIFANESKNILQIVNKEDVDGVAMTYDDASFLLTLTKEVVIPNNETPVLYEIDHPTLRHLIPSYIDQMRKVLIIRRVTITDVLYDNAISMRNVFCQPRIITTIMLEKEVNEAILWAKRKREVLYVNNHLYKLDGLRNQGVLAHHPKACEILLSGGQRGCFEVNLPSESLIHAMKRELQTILNEVIMFSVPPISYDTLLTGYSKISRIRDVPPIEMRLTALSALNRLHDEVTNTKGTLFMTVYANKGTGKTTMTKIMCEKLADIYKRPCYRIDSDAVGRWLQTDMSKEQFQKMTFEEILKFNEYSTSIYEVMAENIVAKLGDIKLEQILRGRYSRVNKAIEQFRVERGEYILTTKDYPAEHHFYSKIASIAPYGSIVIVEGHTLSQDAYLAPTNVSLIYESIMDPYLAFNSRDNAKTELFLYLAYDRELAHSHTKFCMLEFNDWAVMRSRSN
ncbi:hypothetical protein [Daphnis nerii cypovirus]|uniref:hypothetical protein n=1 Tax=Daphnis nerii cypovirus TaxID=1986950 RepID=UPI000EB705EB|nr:hypothetical protein [Daphnis nerii cypovirus]AYA29386.1 hypothetical protein [Daphnis nerii cypovirus]